ncbi:MAG: sortase [Flexilinea sp.]
MYWQVGSSATLGTRSTFVGNILAYASITDNGGSTIYGSFLASTAAVTLNNATITRQICAPIVTKSFSPTEIEITSLLPSRLTITISNITNITSKRNLIADFIDTLPTGLEIAAIPNLDTTCGDPGLLTATAGTSSITMPNGYILTGTSTSCTITVDVTSSTAGSYINRIENGDLQTAFGDNLIPASATLLVTDSSKNSPTITTTLSDSSVTAGNAVYDTASLAGTYSPVPAAGEVIYTVFSDDICSLIAHEAGTVTLLSNGDVPDSSSVTFDAAGTYYWQAVYSGDDNNNGAISVCTSEILTVSESIGPTPTPGPTPGPTAAPTTAPTPESGETTPGITTSKYLPKTGFSPNRLTILAAQPAEKAYADLGFLWLEIPSLSVDIPIVGIPQQPDGEWDVSWLDDQAGWLNNTAFPTLAGNSVLTGHVVNAKGKPGPFIGLYGLSWGDKVIIHAWGSQYNYEVRQVSQVKPEDISAVLKHEDLPYITLITCRGYDEADDSYKYRVVVRAVQVEFE